MTPGGNQGNPVPTPISGRLALGLQVFLAAEVAGMVIAGLWLSGRGYGGPAIAAILAGWFFGLRVLVVANAFRISEANRSPRAAEHVLDSIGAFRMWWGEYWFTQITYSFLFPFERRLVPLAPVAAAGGTGVPVVLVPGFACNRGYWAFMVRALERAGIGPVYAVTLEPIFGSIDDNARCLGEFVEAVCRATGQPRVHLLGHSMGGLTIRAWVHSGDRARAQQVITLGSPHHGTLMAAGVSALGEDLRQMCFGHPWLESLNAKEVEPFPVPITSILTPHDNIVYPQDSAVLRYPNAKNVILAGEGHLQMVRSPRVIAEVVAVLRA